MFDLSQFIKDAVTLRQESLFAADMSAYAGALREQIRGKRLLVIGGAGSIGSQYIKSILPFEPASLVVVDINENALVRLTRDLRSSFALTVPSDYRSYTLSYDDPIFRRIYAESGGFDIVANFSAHKHVRSEKDRFSVQALLENNVIKAARLLDLLSDCPPEHYFCVSTDKAAGPVNVMGASKRLMEDLIMAYVDCFPVTTARFANVAFSNGSLPQSFLDRMEARQVLVAPSDVRRYFVSPEESGQICLLASILGQPGEIFFPRLEEAQMLRFSTICDRFLAAMGLEKRLFSDPEEAKAFAAAMPADSRVYPVVYSRSDTTGEKAYEEFYTAGESPDFSRFQSLGVLQAQRPHRRDEIRAFLDDLSAIFTRPDFTKADIVAALEDFIPGFHHEEKGKNLDQKM